MDYACSPDLDSSRNLTVDAVILFQRFRQDADVKHVKALGARELAQHIKLCELAILSAASVAFYWCRLPSHPLPEIEAGACEHLADMGFLIAHQDIAQERSGSDPLDREKEVTTVVVDYYSRASWNLAKPLEQAALSAESRRRATLEAANLAAHPPQRQSSGSGENIKPGSAAWAAVLDGKYVAEVQRLHRRMYLCLFDLSGRFLHLEKTAVAFGAAFGPDVDDVAAWQERASQIVAAGKWGEAGSGN